jgi:ribonuclease G
VEREILISFDGEEPRVAVLEDGRLVEIYIERPLTQRIVGNIYKGRVQNVLPGMQAAFVDIGIERNAFLFVDDAYPPKVDDLDDDGFGGEAGADGRPRDRQDAGRPERAAVSIRDLVHEGQEVLVQIAKEPTGTKGARVTRNLTIPGRYLVLMPTVDYIGVSRRIQDEAERERLKSLVLGIHQRRTGVIVRTVAEGRSEEDLRADWTFLRRTWLSIRQKAKRARAPALLYKDLGLVPRIMRDQLNESVVRIVLDDAEERRHLMDFLAGFAPEFRERVELFDGGGGQTLFGARGVDDDLEKALQRRVWLRSGGYLVIDQMEALTAIDVNTGKFIGSTDLADTVFRTNLEAAAEIARQLRLRDIGGIIVVDFIDMEVTEHRRRVLQALAEACRPDHSKPTILGLTQLGLVEMTRKKARQSLRDLLTKPCPYCEGRGRVLSEETVSRRVRGEIRRILRSTESEAVLIEVHPSVAALLIGAGGSNLKDLERETGRSIFIRGSESCHVEQMNLRALGTRREVEERARPVREGEVIELKVEEPHVSNTWDGIARVEGYVIDIEGGGKKVGERVRVEITKAFRTYARGKIV